MSFVASECGGRIRPLRSKSRLIWRERAILQRATFDRSIAVTISFAPHFEIKAAIGCPDPKGGQNQWRERQGRRLLLGNMAEFFLGDEVLNLAIEKLGSKQLQPLLRCVLRSRNPYRYSAKASPV